MLKTLKIIILQILVVLVVFELAGRAVGFSPSDFFSYNNYFGESHYPKGYYEADPVTGFTMAKNVQDLEFNFGEEPKVIFTNSLGCMDRKGVPEGDYILLLGDSFTWGFADYNSKWGTRLEAALGQRVAKCGITFSGQRHQLIRAKKIVKVIGHAPKAVIVGYFENDAGDDINFPHATVYKGMLAGGRVFDEETKKFRLATPEEMAARYEAWKQRRKDNQSLANTIKQYSLTANVVWQGLKALTGQRSEIAYPAETLGAAYATHPDTALNRQALKDLNAWTKGHGGKLLLVFMPSYDLANERYAGVKPFLDQQGIPYIDPREAMQGIQAEVGKPLHWQFDFHLNDLGNEVLAQVITPWVREQLER